MKQLANHVSLFSSHDDTGYLTKYVDPVRGTKFLLGLHDLEHLLSNIWLPRAEMLCHEIMII